MAKDKWRTFGLFGTLRKNFIRKFHNFFIFLCYQFYGDPKDIP